MSLALIVAAPVSVTREHLAKGIAGRCWNCALALAIVDAIEDATAARVCYVSRPGDEPDVRADVTLAGGSIVHLALGPDVARIMAAIDAGRTVEPFAFVAEVRTA